MPANNTIGLAGRFCNHIIRNLYVSFLAEVNNLAITYSYADEMKELGIVLYTSGTKTHTETIIIRDEQFCDYLDKTFDYNIFVDWLAAQNHPFALRIYEHFRSSTAKAAIQSANKYKERYGRNNDVFVHVRLDDVAHLSPGYNYYEAAILATCASSGYISSDSPDHPFVTGLAKKYNLIIFNENEVNTIMIGATCRHVVLSYGTFSWVIGVLAFDADVYIPPAEFRTWCGDIFRMPGWKIITPN